MTRKATWLRRLSFGCASTVLGSLGLIAATPSAAQDVKVYVTSLAGDRITAKPPLRFDLSARSEGVAFKIDPGVLHQRMDGFGASFNEAGLTCLNSLDAATQDAVLKALFDPNDGSGFSLMRTPIGATAFSAGPWYSYDDNPGDAEMRRFSVERDVSPTGVVTYIKRARQHGAFALLASMNYPPDWLVTDIAKRQDIDARNYDAIARYLLAYVREYEKQGVAIDYLSPFNEPGTFAKLSYEKVRDLLKASLGPQFEKEKVKTKLLLSEAPSRDEAFKRYPVVLADPDAWQYVAVIPYHGYDFANFARVTDLAKRFPGIPLWMTEAGHTTQTESARGVRLPRYDYEDGDFWGNQIFSDVEAGASAWLYANLILDEKGGPWLASPVHGAPDANIQHPVVVIDRGRKVVTYSAVYYYLSHFSRFVRPGALRIETSGGAKGVRALAFQSREGGMTVELLNSRPEPTVATLSVTGRSGLRVLLLAQSITTCVW
jgi:glucosylceramidase